MILSISFRYCLSYEHESLTEVLLLSTLTIILIPPTEAMLKDRKINGVNLDK